MLSATGGKFQRYVAVGASEPLRALHQSNFVEFSQDSQVPQQISS